MPAKLKIEERRLESLAPYLNNARAHSDKQIAEIAASIREFGFVNPILAGQDTILAGHGRAQAARLLGLETVPVINLSHLTPVQQRAYVIADNRLAEKAGWDLEMLEEELDALKAEGFDIDITGWGEDDLNGLFDEPTAEALPDPDEIPQEEPIQVSKTGEIWAMGPHRLMCGDSTREANWQLLMGRKKASCIFTDPPYGVTWEGVKAPGRVKYACIDGDRKRHDDLYKMLAQAFKQLVKHSNDTAGFYIWYSSSQYKAFLDAMEAVGLVEIQNLVWIKNNMVLGNRDYQWKHEPCFYACKDGQTPDFYGDRTNNTVWQFATRRTDDVAAVVGNGMLLTDGEGNSLFISSKPPKNKRVRSVRMKTQDKALLTTGDHAQGTVWEVTRDIGYKHPTQKPVELATRAIENSTKPGEVVVDAFLGSGTTLIGCELTGRTFYGMEQSPKYIDVAIRRWQKVTGRKAVRIGDNKAFGE